MGRMQVATDKPCHEALYVCMENSHVCMENSHFVVEFQHQCSCPATRHICDTQIATVAHQAVKTMLIARPQRANAGQEVCVHV